MKGYKYYTQGSDYAILNPYKTSREMDCRKRISEVTIDEH